MLINNILMQYQNDPLYAGEIMTSPIYQKNPDYIRDWGCLLVAKLNAYNLFNKNKNYLNIKQLNDLMIKHKGYNYLFYMSHNHGDVEKTKKDCFGRESFQIPAIINWILSIKNEANNWTGKIDINSINDYFIIKTKYKTTGHFSLVVSGDDNAYLDSYDGNIKHPTTIYDIIKITF
jgi:hypothetical protein